MDYRIAPVTGAALNERRQRLADLRKQRRRAWQQKQELARPPVSRHKVDILA
jgi:hypothetical protein